MLGCDEAGIADIHATALNAAVNGSILAVPEACFVTRMALPFGSTRIANRPRHQVLTTVPQALVGTVAFRGRCRAHWLLYRQIVTRVPPHVAFDDLNGRRKAGEVVGIVEIKHEVLARLVGFGELEGSLARSKFKSTPSNLDANTLPRKANFRYFA